MGFWSGNPKLDPRVSALRGERAKCMGRLTSAERDAQALKGSGRVNDYKRAVNKVIDATRELKEIDGKIAKLTR